jgi:hypothetical protein
MGIFKSSKTIPTVVPDLAPIAETVMQHFRSQGYEVAGGRTILQGWDISLHKGGMFQAVIGTKTALKIRIETVGANTEIEAGIGIFGEQAIPTAISMLVFWPVLVTQLWGIVKQAKLDEEAIAVTEQAIATLAASKTTESGGGRFCHACGHPLTEGAKFCPECGEKQ